MTHLQWLRKDSDPDVNEAMQQCENTTSTSSAFIMHSIIKVYTSIKSSSIHYVGGKKPHAGVFFFYYTVLVHCTLLFT